MASALLAVGFIARAHGIRGRVLLTPYNGESLGLERASAFWLRPRGSGGDGKQYQVERAERVNLGYILALRGVPDRTAAELLKGSEALVARAELPELEAGEIWAADLVGMRVVDQAGAERGEVVGLEAAGPNELLQVKAASGLVLVPMGLLQTIDREAGRVVIDAPEGLFDVG